MTRSPLPTPSAASHVATRSERVGHLREADLLLVAALLDDPQRGAVVTAGDHVKPVGGPVEGAGDLRPCERLDGLVIVADHVDKLIAGGAIQIGVGRHGG